MQNSPTNTLFCIQQDNIGLGLLWGAFQGERERPECWKGVSEKDRKFEKLIVYTSLLVDI